MCPRLPTRFPQQQQQQEKQSLKSEKLKVGKRKKLLFARTTNEQTRSSRKLGQRIKSSPVVVLLSKKEKDYFGSFWCLCGCPLSLVCFDFGGGFWLGFGTCSSQFSPSVGLPGCNAVSLSSFLFNKRAIPTRTIAGRNELVTHFLLEKELDLIRKRTIMLKHKTALVLVRVSDPTAVRSPGSSNNNGDLGTVVLHRKSYVVKPSGSVDSTGKKIPALDTPGVSKRGHLEINAKM